MITETMTNILPKRSLSKLNDFIHHKYKMLKEIVSNDRGLPSLNKVEANIPVIKKIELMMHKRVSEVVLNN